MSKAVGESEVELRKWAVQQAIATIEATGDYNMNTVKTATQIYTWITTGKAPK